MSFGSAEFWIALLELVGVNIVRSGDNAALIALAARAPHWARNLLRWFLRQHELSAPSTARLAAMLDQLSGAAPAARVRLVHAGAEVGFHRGRIAVHAPAVAPFAIRWRGDALAIVLGIGVDVAFQAAAGTPGCIVRWRPKGR